MTIEETIEKLEKSGNVNDQKRLAIVKEVMAGANRISELSRQLPRRRFYVKKINRRPMKKKKKALLYSQMCLSNLLTATKIYQIQHQPVPRYEPGTLDRQSCPTIVHEGKTPEGKTVTGILIKKGIPDKYKHIFDSFSNTEICKEKRI